MKTLLATIILGCMLCSCEDPIEEQQRLDREKISQESTWLSHEMRYYHDDNTKLCYAVMWLGGNASVLTNVPCSEAVMDLAKNYKSNK